MRAFSYRKTFVKVLLVGRTNNYANIIMIIMIIIVIIIIICLVVRSRRLMKRQQLFIGKLCSELGALSPWTPWRIYDQYDVATTKDFEKSKKFLVSSIRAKGGLNPPKKPLHENMLTHSSYKEYITLEQSVYLCFSINRDAFSRHTVSVAATRDITRTLENWAKPTWRSSLSR